MEQQIQTNGSQIAHEVSVKIRAAIAADNVSAVAEYIKSAKNIEIKTKEDVSFVKTQVKALTTVGDQLDVDKKIMLAPFKEISEKFREISEAIEETKKELKRKLLIWDDIQTMKLTAETQQANPGQNANIIAVSKTADFKTRETWTFEIEDEKQIPEKYWIIDKVQIGKDIRG